MAQTPDLEDPENTWGTSLPVLFTGAYQTRQFGVGDADTIGPFQTVAVSLATVPANMTSAINKSATRAVGLYVVSQSDKDRYSAAAGLSGGSP